MPPSARAARHETDVMRSHGRSRRPGRRAAARDGRRGVVAPGREDVLERDRERRRRRPPRTRPSAPPPTSSRSRTTGWCSASRASSANAGSSSVARRSGPRARTRTARPAASVSTRSPALVLEPGVGDLDAPVALRAARLPVASAGRRAPEVELEVLRARSARARRVDDDGRARAASRGRRSADRAHVVRDEEDRAALVAQPVELVEALLLEGGVADGEHLVDQQHVGVDLDHHREREPHVHARRVVLELQVLELAQLGELDDRARSARRASRRRAARA